MVQPTLPLRTYEEYLERLETSHIRLEFVDGLIYAILRSPELPPQVSFDHRSRARMAAERTEDPGGRDEGTGCEPSQGTVDAPKPGGCVPPDRDMSVRDWASSRNRDRRIPALDRRKTFAGSPFADTMALVRHCIAREVLP
jgi:hypothetical protein